MSDRITTFDEFWKHYLHEHRDPRSRWLHFLGSTGWMTSLGISAALNPVYFPLALGGFALALAHGLKVGEGERPRLENIAAMVIIPSLASPVVFPAGVVFAYANAWFGHFVIEKNRPATFKYPLWSFACDLRMVSHMLRGRLWTGDPLEELGLAPA